jgi:hypothetical protein
MLAIWLFRRTFPPFRTLLDSRKGTKMKVIAGVSFLIVSATSTGCISHVVLSDVVLQRGTSGDLVVQFKTDIEILGAAEWPSAHLRVPAQQVEPEPSIPDCPEGAVWLSCNKIIAQGRSRDDGGVRFLYRCAFPASGKEFCRTWTKSVEYRYDLTQAGEYEVEFQTYGGTCMGPGAFSSDSVTLKYIVP